MLNKILIVDTIEKDRKELEQILQEVVEEGGELFFAGKKEDALSILKKERPQLLLLDANLCGEDLSTWQKEGVHLILLGQKKGGVNKDLPFLHKPFKATQVLEMCRTWLGEEPVAKVPPM